MLAEQLGLPAERVEAELEGFEDVWPANYNTATQLVVGGRTEALAKAGEKLKAAGAKRVLPLNVSAAFHTPLMQPAAADLRRTLDRIEWHEPAFAVPANVNAEPHTRASEIPGLLERQLYSPVRWADCVNRLIQLGVDTFVEVGPKRALTGMLRELAPSAAALSVSNATSVLEVDLAAASA
jgi:[acyl-carrier-protein] S-malonyltransferase